MPFSVGVNIENSFLKQSKEKASFDGGLTSSKTVLLLSFIFTCCYAVLPCTSQ